MPCTYVQTQHNYSISFCRGMCVCAEAKAVTHPCSSANFTPWYISARRPNAPNPVLPHTLTHHPPPESALTGPDSDRALPSA